MQKNIRQRMKPLTIFMPGNDQCSHFTVLHFFPDFSMEFLNVGVVSDTLIRSAIAFNRPCTSKIQFLL